MRAATGVLSDAGAELVELEIPELEESLGASAVIAASEGLDVHHERLSAGAEGYGEPVLLRLRAAYAFTGLDLARAQRVRRTLVAAYERAFRTVDCMVGPTLPGLPARRGSPTMRVGTREEGIVDASCRLVAPQNMTGVPAASLPCGFSAEGLPIGLQIWAAAGADTTVLTVARRYQERTEWHRRRPRLAHEPASSDSAATAGSPRPSA